MSIVKEIVEAIYKQTIQAECGIMGSHVRSVVTSYSVYVDIRLDSQFDYWCSILYPQLKDETIVVTILGKAIVPSYDVEYFELLLINGNTIKYTAKETE